MDIIFYLREFLKFITLVNTIKTVSDQKKEKIINALTTTQSAINSTQSFLAKSDGEYEIREDLADAWVKAAKSFYFIDSILASMLMGKSSFWSNPKLWLSVGHDRQIPKLNELRDKIELLEKKLH